LHIFELTPSEFRKVTRFARWHSAYIVLVAAFFSAVYSTGLFRVNLFFEEKFIFLVYAPLATLVFVSASPWRIRWKDALRGMYRRLEGQTIFCALGAFLFVFGFFIYSVLIWGLGAFVPSLLYM
jgi:multisubunit Na+/H+ antiporter MnhG subunit